MRVALLLLLVIPAFVDANPTQSTGSWIFLTLDPLDLVRVAQAYGQDTIVISSVGYLLNATINSTGCWNVSYEVPVQNLLTLQLVMDIVVAKNLSIFVGLLDMQPGAPPEYTVCSGPYAAIQGQIASLIESLFMGRYGANVKFGYYMVEEPGLNFLSYSSDCDSDGETWYYMQKVAAINADTKHWRPTMVSPYFLDITPEPCAKKLDAFMRCTNITIVAPQDGVGSFGRNITGANSTTEFFSAFAAARTGQYHLWANVETFMPHAEICNDAPASRIAAQVAAVAPNVAKVINFWAFNLPNAPPCTPW